MRPNGPIYLLRLILIVECLGFHMTPKTYKSEIKKPGRFSLQIKKMVKNDVIIDNYATAREHYFLYIMVEYKTVWDYGQLWGLVSNLRSKKFLGLFSAQNDVIWPKLRNFQT